MAYVIVAFLSAAAVAVLSYLYHSKVAAKVAAVEAEIEKIEGELVVDAKVAVARIKALL